MGYQVTEVQKALKGFDYPGSKDDLATHAEKNGAESGLVDTLRGLKKDSFDGPNAVMYPEAAWYGGLSADDARGLADHLTDGTPVTGKITDPPGPPPGDDDAPPR